MPEVNIEIVENPVSVEVSDSNISVNVTEEITSLVVGTSGPQGPQGEAGAPGEVLYSDLSYVHTQSVPSTTWTINHGLQFIPNITVVDSAGTVVEGSYEYPNANTVVLNFSGNFSGKAYLS